MATGNTTEVKSEKGSIWIFERVLQDDVNYKSLTPTTQFVDKKTQDKIIKSWSEYDEDPKKKKENDKIRSENEILKQNGKQPKPLKTRKWATWLNIRLDKKYTELAEIWDPQNKQKDQSVEGYDWSSVPLDWQKSFYAQQEAMLEKFSASNFKVMKFGRADEPFGKFIEGLVKPLGIQKKDTWNPADIWIVDRYKENNVERILTQSVSFKAGQTPNNLDLSEKNGKLAQLNEVLRSLYASKTIIGVSLKLTKEKADYIDVNVVLNAAGLDEAATNKRFQEIEDLLGEIDNIRCDLSIQPFSKIYTTPKAYLEKTTKMQKLLKLPTYPINPMSFGTQETSIQIKESDDKIYFLTIKATQTSEYSNLKYEPTEKGKSSAKLGKAGVKQVDELFKKYGIKFENDNSKYPKVYNSEVDKIVNTFSQRKNTSGISFFTGESSSSNFLKNIKEVYASDPVTAQSKLMQLDLFSEILSLKDIEVRKLMTDIVYIAKKEGRTYGPFGKVY
jgi:uncharacterized protein YbaA (DUF1428 family)